MESTLFKITGSVKDSGIFYGPMTAVYGVGIISIIFLFGIRPAEIVKNIVEEREAEKGQENR